MAEHKLEKLFINNRKSQKICVLTELTENPTGLVFVMHGLGGYKEQPQIETLAEVFKEQNFDVIRFDTTNSFGESDGKYEEATLTNYYQDLEDVIAWAEQQSWYQPQFVLTGHSFGGFCTAFYAENFPEKVKALAPISPVVSGELSLKAHKLYYPKELQEWQETGWKITESLSKPGLYKKLPWSHMEDRLKYDLAPKADKLTMPKLLIVGEKDTSTSAAYIEEFFEKLPSKKEQHIIPNAPHTFREADELNQIKQLVDGWVRSLGL